MCKLRELEGSCKHVGYRGEFLGSVGSGEDNGGTTGESSHGQGRGFCRLKLILKLPLAASATAYQSMYLGNFEGNIHGWVHKEVH